MPSVPIAPSGAYLVPLGSFLFRGRHVDIANETENASPSTDDWMLIESNAGGTWRKVQLAAVPIAPGVWTARLAAEANQWTNSTYGNGQFVAVSQTGTNRVMTSSDGVTWTSQSAAEANTWWGITYGNGLFVATASSGTNRVMTSPDGVTWTARSAVEANFWYSVVYGNGLFVAVSTDGTNRVMTSPDGITWTARSASEANNWISVVWGNGLFVAVSQDGTNRVMTSPDGITWTARSASEANTWTDLTYGNGLFVAVSNDGTNRVMTSPDGITWTARSAAEANTWTSITYGNGLYTAVSNDGTNRVMTSPDGITWTSRTAGEANTWTSVTYGNGLFVSTSLHGTNRVMTSGVKRDHNELFDSFTGVGKYVLDTSPTLITPVLGTPSSGNLSNCTAYEGTAVASTGEEGGTKFLREDGDGTCSWQAAGGGAFTADGDTLITPTTPIVLDQATGNETALTLNYTVNKATSGNDTGLLVSMTDTASPGTSLLQDWQVGGVSVASIDNAGEFGLIGNQLLTHTATMNDDHALEIVLNAAGFGDVKAIDVDYVTGAIASGEDEAVMLINIDESTSTGGDVVGVEVLATDFGAVDRAIAIEVGVTVEPLVQLLGTFGNMDSALNNAVDVLAALSSGGAGNISVFVADNDTVTIGDAAVFNEIEILVDTPASGSGIFPTFEFSTGVGTWAAFSPIDGTNGFRNTGVIAWLDSDVATWAPGTGSEYLIRITRTKNTLTTTPIIDTVQISDATEYGWDANALVSARTLTLAAPASTTGLLITADATPGSHIVTKNSAGTTLFEMQSWGELNINNTGAGNIAEFKSSGTDRFTILTSGAFTINGAASVNANIKAPATSTKGIILTDSTSNEYWFFKHNEHANGNKFIFEYFDGTSTYTEFLAMDPINTLATWELGHVVNSPAATIGLLITTDSAAANPAIKIDQQDIDDSFIDFVGTSAADGSRSISSDTTEDSAKFGAIRVEINGVTKWIRVYDDES